MDLRKGPVGVRAFAYATSALGAAVLVWAILSSAELIFGEGFENLKLYFMIGLPPENDEDLVAIRDLSLQLREIMVRHARARPTL